MSLPRSLLLVVVVVVCTAHLCVAQWPCPDPSVTGDCICTTDTEYEIYMDCSTVESAAELAFIFAQPFPFKDITSLTIDPSIKNDLLTILPSGVFGDKTFEEIYIGNTGIATVEEEALVNSHGTLRFLSLQRNDISRFPIETLELFMYLEEFDISYNKLSGPLPDIVSSAYLHTLNLSGNKGLTLSQTTFMGAPNLTELSLNEMDLGTTTPGNVFLPLKQLKTLYLNNNGISGQLIENFINNELKPLTTVQLIGNDISSIHNLSVTGISAAGTISFSGNQIVYLPHEEWGVLVSEVTQPNAIDLTSNPLVCGCDIAWLVFDSVLMARIDENTKCVGDILMTDLPLDWFADHCSGAPMQSSPQPPHLTRR